MKSSKTTNKSTTWMWWTGGAVLLAVLLVRNKNKVIEISDMILDTWDKYTNSRLKSLHPIIQPLVAKVINALAQKGIFIRITADGHYRTFAKQQELYNQGRTNNLPIVTNAKPGSSWHNYGLAVDVVEIKDGKALFTNPRWSVIADEFKKEGFEWGGDFNSIKDYPHFQYRPNGITIAQALAMHNSGNLSNGYINVA